MWDFETTFSNRQALTEGDSENMVDTGGDDMGLGGNALLQVALGGNSQGTLAVNLQTSNSSSMANSVRVAQYVVDAGKVGKGGVVLAAALPTGCRRYLKLSYSGATGGTITAGLVQGAQTSGMR